MPSPLLNDVSMIVGKLRLENNKTIPPNVVQQTKSALRLFKVQHPRGSLGDRDNDWKRACSMLEYTARELEGIKIPMDKLAKLALMKQTDFVKFHQRMGNCRQRHPSSSNKASSTTLTQQQQQQKQQQQQHYPPTLRGRQTTSAYSRSSKLTTTTTSYSSKKAVSSSIPSLSIRLGPMVSDSNGVARRAQQLYQEILHYVRHTMAPTQRLHQLNDMERFQSAYEAACFYLEATHHQPVFSTTTTSSSSSSSSSTSSQAASKRTTNRHHQHYNHHKHHNNNHHNPSMDQHDDDSEDQKRLEISTLLDVSTDFTPSEFKNVLEHVQTMVQDSRKENTKPNPTTTTTKTTTKTTTTTTHTKRKQQPKQQHSLESVQKRQRIGPKKHPSSLLEAKQLASAATRELLQKCTDTATKNEKITASWTQYNESNTSTIMTENGYAPRFLEWKRNVVATAVKAAKEAMLRAEETEAEAGAGAADENQSLSTTKSSITHEQALCRAACDVLKAHGLL